jgi:CRP/FNR family transcriptional regulator, dissimilatory nitrate respiration regulator
MKPKPISLPIQLISLLSAELQQQCVSQKCSKGERLFEQGQQPERMFYICNGEAVLQRVGLHGASLVLQRVRQGFISEASLQSDSYHCEAAMTASGDLVCIPISAIKLELLTNPEFAMRWVAMLNKELKRLRAQCERLSLKSVKDRLLHLIETEGEEGKLALGTGLKSIAAELSVSHEALYRTVADLEKQNVLYRLDDFICYKYNS